MVYPYQNVITGFATRLTAEEAKAMEKKDNVLFVRKETILALHTTHSPKFLLGLHQELNGKREFEGMACNNKLIDARIFQYVATKKDALFSKLPLDDDGHGTHVLSITVGNFVKGTNVLGNAKGTAAGTAPLAHLAMYKVCSGDGCPASAILVGFDVAIEDGVDVIFVSLGVLAEPIKVFFQDIVGIGAFKAMERGIFVSASAGNVGPFNSTMVNGLGTLNKVNVKGKMVLCAGGGGQEAIILMNDELDGFNISADEHVLPATHGGYADGLKIKAYINSTSQPVASIVFKGTVIEKSCSPMISSTSSRGPSLVSTGTLKPDVIGLGTNILAAWPTIFTPRNNDNLNSALKMNSGTLMSCPHLSGMAALLKSSHPDWSPATIKFVIITTFNALNLEGKPIFYYNMVPANIFATGAGHVNPSKANDPGLIYDIQPGDYIPYLCGLNYAKKELALIVSRTVKCLKI
ncbi:hypothetical protein SO802_034035 [Lithocarpus litseifolius]|uniref:Uncharacterized protein n=1 Tax=Lithocarpus litseifolius TaxID=425828 RepID=A0AAW2BK52_9ROSI